MKTILLILSLLCSGLCRAQSTNTTSVIQFTWSVTNTALSNATSYIIEYGTNSGVYFGSTNVGTNTSITVSNFPHGIEWYFVIQCYNSQSNLLGTTRECYYGYMVPVPLPNPSAVTPVITETIIQP